MAPFLDLGILWKSRSDIYMGKGYVSLSDPKDDGRLSLLSHHLPWYQLEDEGIYAVWGDMFAYCRYCHAERHIIPDCPKKKVHPMFVGIVVLVYILLLNAQKQE